MLVVFDWDGTIIDSSDKIVLCMQKAAADIGLEPNAPEEVRNIIGLGLPEAMRILFPDEPESTHGLVRVAYSKHFIEMDKVPCPFFDGVEDCLSVLKDEGVKIAVATGKSRAGLNRVLGNLGWQEKFDATRCADETASKPHPRMLMELMSEIPVNQEKVFMVGDTIYDMEMARNANVKPIGVSYGVHSPERLKDFNPVAIVDNLMQITKEIL